MFTADMAYPVNLADVFRSPLAVEVRKVTDLAPRTEALDRFLKSLVVERTPSATSSSANVKRAQIDQADDGLAPAPMSPWLVDTMNIIEMHRNALSMFSAADKAERLKMLGTAEMLASFLADVGPHRRPQISIDEEGRPSFASALDNFYFHLTVDAPDAITWFAKVHGAEYFDEGVQFGGRSLPPPLRQIFAA